MKFKMRMFSKGVLQFFLLNLPYCQAADNAGTLLTISPVDIITNEVVRPEGEYYEATVPDTLDLAERAHLSVRGLTSFLNPRQGYAPYGQAFFNVNPAFMSQTEIGRGEPSWGKIAESLVKARLMCGSTENLDIQVKMMRGMLMEKGIVALNGPTSTSRALYALIALYQTNPTPELRAQIDSWILGHVNRAKKDGDAAYYSDGPPDPSYSYIWQAFVQGSALRVISQWYAVTGDAQSLELAHGLCNHLTRPKYWPPEAEPRSMVGAEHGHFMGHTHAYVQSLLGILWYGDSTGNVQCKQFARSGYEYMRCFGLSNIGLYGEMCTTGDMTQLAIKLCDSGAGDYWDDVDRYVRNHLTELQITDSSKLESIVNKLSSYDRKLDPNEETNANVIQRCVGTYFSDSTHPAMIPAPQQANARGPLMWTICCTGNCTPALYYAWESIVRGKGDTAEINLLLNRASPWLDIDSYLPHEGKVVIHNKTAKRIAIRIPGWVDKRMVTATILNKRKTIAASISFAGQYAILDNLSLRDTITITFPMTTRIEKYTLKWPVNGFWTETTLIKPEIKIEPVNYTMKFRGNTMIDIAPRPKDFGYQLYQRQLLDTNSVSIRKVTRFIPKKLISNYLEIPND